jgi:hypothetical protein
MIILSNKKLEVLWGWSTPLHTCHNQDVPVDPRRHTVPDFANMPVLTDDGYSRLQSSKHGNKIMSLTATSWICDASLSGDRYKNSNPGLLTRYIPIPSLTRSSACRLCAKDISAGTIVSDTDMVILNASWKETGNSRESNTRNR